MPLSLPSSPLLVGGDDPADDGRQRAWQAWSTLAGVGAGLATRTLIKKLWQARTGEEPPENPADPAVRWSQALGWAVGLGIGVGVARTVAQRGAAKAWEQATGTPPPGIASTRGSASS